MPLVFLKERERQPLRWRPGFLAPVVSQKLGMHPGWYDLCPDLLSHMVTCYVFPFNLPNCDTVCMLVLYSMSPRLSPIQGRRIGWPRCIVFSVVFSQASL